MGLKTTLTAMLVILTFWLPAWSHGAERPAQEITLLEAIEKISKEYEVYFTFDMTLVTDVRVKYNDNTYSSAEEAISNILKGTTLKYKFYDHRFVILYQEDVEGLESLKQMSKHLVGLISKGEKSMVATTNRKMRTVTSLSSRPMSKELEPLAFNIEGTVVDQEGEPLIGVNIQVKGTNKGTATDLEGQFSLEDIDEQSVLIVSYIGYQKQEVAIAGKSSLNITLLEDSQTLEEVVVVGYGTQKKENLTGAVSYVGSDVLESRPITTLGQGLQGEVSNLNIEQGDGSLGKGSSFNIRGTTSINGGEPLILVDGVPMDINLLNPSDIESVSVLKDAASAAIYGARAAYGVMLITTKSGKKEKPTISLSTLFSSNSPTTTIDFIDTKERIGYMNEASLRVNGTPYYDDIMVDAMLAHYNDPSQPSAIIHPSSPTEWTGVANTDWESILMNESYPMQKHNISISGGSDNFDYYSSFSYLNQKGLTNRDLFNEKFNRYNFMTNLNYKVFDWVHVGAKVSINNSDKRFPPNDPQFRNAFPEGGTIYQTNVFSTQPYKDPNGNWSHQGSIENPAQMLSDGGHQTRDINDVWMTGELRLLPIKNVSVNLDYSFNAKKTNELAYIALQPFYDVEGNVTSYYRGSNPNGVTRTTYDDKYYILNAFADYTNTFADKHYFKFMVGFNQENAQYSWIGSERRNLIINSIPYMSLASGEAFAEDGISEFAIRGAFSRLNYIYDSRYLIEFNGRYDGTSKFPKDNRFDLFPSISLGWRIDNESFFSGLKEHINTLKLRASLGNLGNQNVRSNYPYISTLNAQQANYILGGDKPTTIYAPGLVSSTLTWETVTQKNIGLDFAFFNYKLSGSVDVYNRETKNMLTKSKTLPAVLAVAEPRANAADLRTKGFELNLEWKDDIGEVEYRINGVLSDYIAEITKFDNPAGLINDYYVGGKIGDYWGLTTGGLFQSDEEAAGLDQSNIAGRKRQAGDLWMVDLDGDGKITRGNSTLDNPGDLSIIGNSTPRYSFGFRTFVGWKGFDLDLFFQGVGKQDLWMNTRYWLTQYSNEWVGIAKVAMDYWSPENRDAFFPRPIIRGANDVYTLQSRYLQNAAYIRLKQLTVGYNIPSALIQGIGIDRVRVYFSGSNLWTGTKMVDISDPELSGPSSYPLYKSLAIGANINF